MTPTSSTDAYTQPEEIPGEHPTCRSCWTNTSQWFASTRLVIAIKWAAGKLREIPQLRKADLYLANVERFANDHKQRQELIRVALDSIDMLHPINRDSAEEKTRKRHEAALAARDLLEGNDWVLSESLINDNPALHDFKSITGVCVVANDGRYYALEGNGRIAALQDIHDGLLLEVRQYHYKPADHERLLQLITTCREANGIADQP